MDSIDTLRAFVTVVQEGSFTAGARRLGLSTKLVSKQVARLEADLGAQLMTRTTRSLALTDAGADCLPRARALVEQFDDLGDRARERQRDLSGPVRVTAPTGFGRQRLVPALAPFLAAHPGIGLDLRLTDRRVALVEDGIDLAVRIGRLRDSGLMLRRLAPMPLVLVASPGYLARAGRPERPEDLPAHDCLIDAATAEDGHWRFRGPEGAVLAVRIAGRVQADAPAAIAGFAEAGLGIGRCPLYAVEDAIAAGRLLRLMPGQEGEALELVALWPQARHLPARVRALIDHLAERFGDGAPLPPGPRG